MLAAFLDNAIPIVKEFLYHTWPAFLFLDFFLLFVLSGFIGEIEPSKLL
jgi:hypothetical protein